MKKKEIIKIVQKNIKRICSIYPTVKEAFYDEPQERLELCLAQEIFDNDFALFFHEDYHDIDARFTTFDKATELGSFQIKGCRYGLYCGLYYNGSKPSKEIVLKELNRFLDYDSEEEEKEDLDVFHSMFSNE